MSLCISVVTALNLCQVVISVNGLVQHHESLYLRGYCKQSVCGVISVKDLALHQSRCTFQIGILIGYFPTNY